MSPDLAPYSKMTRLVVGSIRATWPQISHLSRSRAARWIVA